MTNRPPTTEAPALDDDPLPRVVGRYWLAFSPDTPPDVARRRFVERYGAEPREVLAAGALLLVGPLPGRGER